LVVSHYVSWSASSFSPPSRLQATLIPGIPGLPDAMKVTNPDIIIVLSALRHWV
jgi:hypothetical protein